MVKWQDVNLDARALVAMIFGTILGIAGSASIRSLWKTGKNSS